ncbi:hypothetical protein [Desulfonatronovibrio hydrogenovorans]|uniref:hypothetical protein n=1 Tax=Desulfonatronovibrio hydrogenovorans TaxID=53245 RepID=UPI00048BB020|nr:hypothetical protein [Desulfonatronovibrio hydrogenovorans]
MSDQDKRNKRIDKFTTKFGDVEFLEQDKTLEQILAEFDELRAEENRLRRERGEPELPEENRKDKA